MDTKRSRRRLLQAAGVTLATGLAGCQDSGVTRNPNSPDTGGTATPSNGTDDEPDGDTHEFPENPPAQYRGETREFSHRRLPVFKENPDPDDLSSYRPGSNPDSSVFTLEVQNSSRVELTISEALVERPLLFTLYVRDASNTYQERTVTIEPTDGEYTILTHTFDISRIDIPRMAGGFMQLVVGDSHPGNPYRQVAAQHQFVGIPHNNGTEWFNSPSLNYKHFTGDDGFARTRSPRGVMKNGEWVTRRETPAGAIKTIDGDNERTILMAVYSRFNGEVWGVSCHIDHAPARRYKNGTDRYQWRYGFKYECENAEQISHFGEFATKTDEAITRLDLDAPHMRLQALGDLIQMIPYELQGDDPPGTVVLYDSYGDCSSKSMLLSCILQNDPWDILPAYIDCEINGYGHWTAGLDIDDLGSEFTHPNPFLISPTDEQVSQGYPDTDYAFFDMTYDSVIGERTDGVEGPFVVYDEGDFSHTASRSADDPPDY